jgi:hypothetical protein
LHGVHRRWRPCWHVVLRRPWRRWPCWRVVVHRRHWRRWPCWHEGRWPCWHAGRRTPWWPHIIDGDEGRWHVVHRRRWHWCSSWRTRDWRTRDGPSSWRKSTTVAIRGGSHFAKSARVGKAYTSARAAQLCTKCLSSYPFHSLEVGAARKHQTCS